ncbi:MAG TPA: hypothetical protein VKR32_16230 [Puia sp.]|nr:hypothetical protein [Puia sp.]
MKSYFFSFVLLILIHPILVGQDSLFNESPVRFGLGVNLDRGISQMTENFAGAGLSLQAEYKFLHLISIFAAGGFTIYGGSIFNGLVLNFQAGPRVYFASRFFSGVGLGLSLGGEGSVQSSFTYFPHVGINAHWIQLMMGYNGIRQRKIEYDNSGFSYGRITLGSLQLKAIFKLNL